MTKMLPAHSIQGFRGRGLACSHLEACLIPFYRTADNVVSHRKRKADAGRAEPSPDSTAAALCSHKGNVCVPHPEPTLPGDGSTSGSRTPRQLLPHRQTPARGAVQLARPTRTLARATDCGGARRSPQPGLGVTRSPPVRFATTGIHQVFIVPLGRRLIGMQPLEGSRPTCE